MSSLVRLAASSSNLTVALQAGSRVVLDFDHAGASFSRAESGLLISFAEGGSVLVENFFNVTEGSVLPEFVLADGQTVIDGENFLRSTDPAFDLNPVAGARAEPASDGGLNEYAFDAGDLIGGVDALSALSPDASRPLGPVGPAQASSGDAPLILADAGKLAETGDSAPAPAPQVVPAFQPTPPMSDPDPAPAPQFAPPAPDPEPDNGLIKFNTRAVIYGKSAVANDQAYGVTVDLGGEPVSVEFAGGVASNYVAFAVDAATGEVTFHLTAAGKTAISAANASEMEFYYTVKTAAGTQTIQVIMTGKDVFHSADYASVLGEPARDAIVDEWHGGKNTAAKAYDVDSGDSNDHIALTGTLKAGSVATGSGNDSVSVKNIAVNAVAVDGASRIDLGEGDNSLNIVGKVISSGIAAGAGDDAITIEASLSSGSASYVAVNGTSIDMGGGDNRLNIQAKGSTATIFNTYAVSGSTVDGGSGVDDITISGAVKTTDINTGAGADVVSVSNVVSGATPVMDASTVNLGEGENRLFITAVGSTGAVYNKVAVNNSIISAGDGGNTITVSGSVKGSAIVAGGGDDSITLSSVLSAAAVLDNSSITLGSGADTVNITAERSAATVQNVFALSKSVIDASSGSEGDRITITGQVRDSNISTGDGSDVLNFSGTSSTSAATAAYAGLQSSDRGTFYTLNVGEGDNSINIDYTGYNSASASNRSVGVSGYDVTSGSGNDTVSITADYGVSNVNMVSGKNTYARAGEMNLGDGDDLLKVNGQYGGINNVNLNMGKGDDVADISIQRFGATGSPYSAVENSTINLGAGHDTLRITTDGVNTNALKGSTVHVNEDNLADTLEVTGAVRDTNIYMGGGSDTLTFHSTVNINAGATGTAVAAGLYTTDKTKHHTLDLGEGDNVLRIVADSTTNHETDGTGYIAGETCTSQLRSHAVEGYDIYSGSGNDSIYIKGDYGLYNGKDLSGGDREHSYTELNTGAGDDTLVIESHFSAVYKSKINMGEGDDYTHISSKAGVFALLHDAVIDMGSGNDTLRLDFADMLVTQNDTGSNGFSDYKNNPTSGYFDGNRPDAEINMGDGNDFLMIYSDYATKGTADKLLLPYHTTHLDGGSNEQLTLHNMTDNSIVNVGDILGFGGRLAGMVSSQNLYDHDIHNFESLLIGGGEQDTPINLDNLLSFVDRLETGNANDISSIVLTDSAVNNFNANGHELIHTADKVTIEGLDGQFNAYTVHPTDGGQEMQIFMQVMTAGC